MSFTFTVSKEDFKEYFKCPKKLALKIMGYKARKYTRKQKFSPPSHEIGISGEKLTEQILEIIANIQAEKSLEKVEVLTKRGKREEEIIQRLAKIGRSSDFEKHQIGKLGKALVKLTVEKAFETEDVSKEYVEQYKREIIQKTSQKFSNLVGEVYAKLPKIKSVYKPVLKNRDFCSLGYPDFQIDSEEGPILIEVKNWASINSSLKQGQMDLLYYNSILTDKILSASTYYSEKLPLPTRSLLIVPRSGLVKEINDKIPKYRETAIEIWKIKKAAIVEGKLPHVNLDPSICRRCGFKKYCKEGESLEKAKPLPLLYAVAYQEAEKEIENIRKKILHFPSNLWQAYFTFKKEQQILYRTLTNEFEKWGGMKTIENYHLKISRTSNLLFPQNEEKIEEIIRVVRRKWKV